MLYVDEPVQFVVCGSAFFLIAEVTNAPRGFIHQNPTAAAVGLVCEFD
jgi:hypothetical protein